MSIRILVALAAVLLGACGAVARDRGDLERFGRWVNSKRYGVVWVPKVGLGWTPTNNGTYQQNDDGIWLWLSNDPFWSETSTSGRWLKDRGEKWVWKPGLPPAHTGEGLGGGIVPLLSGGPALPPNVARVREIRYDRAVRDFPADLAPTPPLSHRRHRPNN